MNFNLKLWSLSLLLLIASISFEAKILAGDRTVSIEDSCMIGKDGKEIEASRKTIQRVTMPLKGSSTHDHLTFFHVGAPESCTACMEIEHPVLAVVSPISHTNFQPAPKVIATVAAKPQVDALEKQKRDKEIRDEYRRKQMFDYNFGRFHQAMNEEKFFQGAMIATGCIFAVKIVKVFAEAAKSR